MTSGCALKLDGIRAVVRIRIVAHLLRPGIGDVALALALRCLGLSLGLIGCLALFPVRVSLGLGCARGPRVESNNISLLA